MIIEEIEFKNIKSYGNKLQTVRFDSSGSLMLLTGTNGAGKSTIQDVIDLALFNQVRGKQTSRIPLKYFPNRLNKELYVRIKFVNSNGEEIEIERNMQPNSLVVKRNGEVITERYKVMPQDKKDEMIGFDYNTFRSFISLSMNDFVNFIRMSPEDKRNLLNKLFNLEEIDDYFSITKELVNQKKKSIEDAMLEVSRIDKNLKEYKSIIKDKRGDEDKSLSDMREEVNRMKSEYRSSREKLKGIDVEINRLMNTMQDSRNKANESESDNIRRKTEYNEVLSKIKIYESGKCPYCMSDLTDTKHRVMLDKLIEDKEKYKNLISTNNLSISHFRAEHSSASQQKNLLEETRDSIREEMSELKKRIISLSTKIEDRKDTSDDVIEKLKEKGKKLVEDKKALLGKMYKDREDIDTLTSLKEILSENGIRREIISSLIPPINDSLKRLLKSISYPYDVELDNNFNAVVRDRGEEIYPETLSNGESRILNVCVAISYIEMIRKMNNINILFIDEVFQSIHKDNINIILSLLKDFAMENKINLIVVHQGIEELDSKLFDRILSVEKPFFSDIKETFSRSSGIRKKEERKWERKELS